MLLANVYGRSKMHEVVDVGAVVSERSKFLLQYGLEERFDIVPRPLEAPECDIILRDQPRGVIKKEPHYTQGKKNCVSLPKLFRTVNLNGDCNRTPIKVTKAAERNDGRVNGQFSVMRAWISRAQTT